jgi:nucleotide-binding universal stress UspA family protein/quercetin dioxygenase-like cupin family protein
MQGFRTILHPTDFSENAGPAFLAACSLARDHRATLVVLHVMIPTSSPLISGPPPDPLRPVESQGSLPVLPWPRPPDPGIRVEHRLAEGDPTEEVLRLAAALRCDLIVMGSHGRTGLGRLLAGSVAEAVLRNADCPVMVVRTPLGPAPEAGTEPIAGIGDVVDVRPAGGGPDEARSRTLVRTATLEVIRRVVRAGEEVPRHVEHGDTIVHCLEGRVTCNALGTTQMLEAGKLIALPVGEPTSFRGIEDSTLLLTTLAPRP